MNDGCLKPLKLIVILLAVVIAFAAWVGLAGIAKVLHNCIRDDLRGRYGDAVPPLSAWFAEWWGQGWLLLFVLAVATVVSVMITIVMWKTLKRV
jgi:hypothetical protein